LETDEQVNNGNANGQFANSKHKLLVTLAEVQLRTINDEEMISPGGRAWSISTNAFCGPSEGATGHCGGTPHLCGRVRVERRIHPAGMHPVRVAAG